MPQINTALELFGLLISLLPLIFCLLDREPKDRQWTLLVAMLATNALVLASDILTWCFAGMTRYTALLYIANFLVYSLGHIVTALFTWYLAACLSQHRVEIGRYARVITALCAVAVGLVAISLWNKMYFRFEGGIYIRGPVYWLSQLYPIVIMLADMVIVLMNRRAMGKWDTTALLSCGVLPVLAMAIQIFVYGVTLLYLATTVSMLIIYIMIHVEHGKRLKEQELEHTKHYLPLEELRFPDKLTVVYNIQTTLF